MSECDIDRTLKARDSQMAAEYEAALNLADFDLRWTVLDVATGSGRMLLGLLRRGYSVISGDIDEAALGRARDRLGDLADRPRFMVLDARDMHFEDSSFHAVTLAHAIHEIDDPRSVLGEICRVLTADGKLLVTEFNSQGFRLMETQHRIQGKGKHRRGEMSPQDIDRYLRSAFERVETREYGITHAWVSSGKKQGKNE